MRLVIFVNHKGIAFLCKRIIYFKIKEYYANAYVVRM